MIVWIALAAVSVAISAAAMHGDLISIIDNMIFIVIHSLHTRSVVIISQVKRMAKKGKSNKNANIFKMNNNCVCVCLMFIAIWVLDVSIRIFERLRVPAQLI